MTQTEYNSNTKKELKFHGGKFRILTFSDIHGVKNTDPRLTRDIAAVIDGCKPDLVLFIGDQVWHDGAKDENSLRSVLDAAVSPMEKAKIPWAHVFGNHDEEGGYPKEEQQKVYESYEYCISKTGPLEIHGTGNYVLPVKSSDGKKTVYNIWCIDSGRDLRDFLRDSGLENDYKKALPENHFFHAQTYDCIRFDQMMWYWNTSKELEERNGGKIPALAVFHEALPEFSEVCLNKEECGYTGNKRENIGCGPVNSGLFAAFLQRGDVKTVICGHDHINDFEGTYLGIKMAMDGGMSYDGYCDDDIRGGRIVDIDENDAWNVRTYMVRSSDFVKDYRK